MQEKVYKTKIRDVGQLRQRIIQAWKEFDQAVIDAALATGRSLHRLQLDQIPSMPV